MDLEKDFEEGKSRTSLGSIFYMHHDAGGAAPKLVFLHGVGASHIVWKRLMEVMPGSDYSVYLLDLLGHGNSDAPRIDYTVENQSVALREMLEGIGATDCCLIGHSYGGWISAYYSSVYSGLSGMVLEDSAGVKEEFDQIAGSGRIAEYQESMLKQLLSINDNKDYVMQGILNADFALKYQLSADLLSKVKTRTLIVWGDSDEIVNIRYAEPLLKGIKGSVLKVISGSGHNSHYTHPKEFYSLMEGFISDIQNE